MDRHTPFVIMQEMKHMFKSEVERMNHRVLAVFSNTFSDIQERIIDLGAELGAVILS